ncbi:MAG: hypothetical protein IT381_16380 [Deltaproteobacteria bacterium]|nr:hypothetical protein [Deltaproteobacteria bacterium]
MGAVTYDEGKWPLLRVVMPGAINDAELDAHHSKLSQYIHRGQMMGMVVDSRQMPPLTPEARKRTSEFIKTHSNVAKDNVAAIGLVHASAIQTHVLTAILWIVKPPVLIKVFNNVDSAEEWVNEKLSARKV